jgi:hypothetical protein
VRGKFVRGKMKLLADELKLHQALFHAQIDPWPGAVHRQREREEAERVLKYARSQAAATAPVGSSKPVSVTVREGQGGATEIRESGKRDRYFRCWRQSRCARRRLLAGP